MNMSIENNIQHFLDSSKQVNESYIKAAVGQMLSNRIKELSSEIHHLSLQVPTTISELRQTISSNTDRIIQSNENLSKSNNNYAKWMKFLTLGLVLVGVVQTIIFIIK